MSIQFDLQSLIFSILCPILSDILQPPGANASLNDEKMVRCPEENQTYPPLFPVPAGNEESVPDFVHRTAYA